MARARSEHGKTREAVRRRLAQGMTRAAIATELGISRPTVTYHAKQLGLDADQRFCARQFDWNEISAAYDSGLSVRECMQRFGFSSSAWALAVRRGVVSPHARELPLEELLERGQKRDRGNLKRRLVAAGLKENRCEECGIAEWEGRPLTMALHHVNGDGLDNRLENLLVLCPNCHAQTETFAGRNVRRGRTAALVRPRHSSSLGAGT
jgi:hypothetical protein